MRKFTFSHWIMLLLILGVGIVARVGQFPRLPPGLNQDEAASAYEAYSLTETGLDKWGNHLPAYFPGWGSGQNVLLAYLTVPVVKVFGLSIATARVVMLVLGLLSLPLLTYCLRPLGRYPALLATLLLAVVPWHFMLSRWGLESNLAPFFMLLGCTSLSRALLTQRRRWIVFCLVPFAFSLYAYGTTVLVLPVFFGLLLALMGWQPLRPQLGSWLLAGGLFLLIATPFLLFFVENYVVGHNLAWTDSLFFSTPVLPATRANQVTSGGWGPTVVHNWHFLLDSFNDGTAYNLLPGFKLLLSVTLPFTLVALLAGGWRLLKQRGRPAFSPATCVLGVFAAWGLASLSLFFSFDLNVNRFNHAYLPCIVLAAWAISFTIDNFRPEAPRLLLQAGAMGWLLLEGGWAIHTYLEEYANGPIKTEFNAGMDEAFAAVETLWGVEQVRITTSMPLPYVYTLFYLRYPPAQFQREAQVTTQADGTYHVARFGRYIFSDPELPAGQAYGYLARRDEFPNTDKQHREIIFTNDAWEVGIMRMTTQSH